MDLGETLSDLLGGVHGLLSPHVDSLRGSLTSSLLDLGETLSNLLGGVHGLLDGDGVGGGGSTVNGGMGEAVDLSADGLEGLEVQGDIALSALEAPLVEEGSSSGDLLQRVDSLVADIALRVGHFVFLKSGTRNLTPQMTFVLFVGPPGLGKYGSRIVSFTDFSYILTNNMIKVGTIRIPSS